MQQKQKEVMTKLKELAQRAKTTVAAKLKEHASPTKKPDWLAGLAAMLKPSPKATSAPEPVKLDADGNPLTHEPTAAPSQKPESLSNLAATQPEATSVPVLDVDVKPVTKAPATKTDLLARIRAMFKKPTAAPVSKVDSAVSTSAAVVPTASAAVPNATGAQGAVTKPKDFFQMFLKKFRSAESPKTVKANDANSYVLSLPNIFSAS
jgi:hypothetical protein